MQVQRHIQYLTAPRLILELPASFANQQVEVLVLTLDDASPETQHKRRRVPPPQFTGKVRESGDVFDSVPFEDWGLAE